MKSLIAVTAIFMSCNSMAWAASKNDKDIKIKYTKEYDEAKDHIISALVSSNVINFVGVPGLISEAEIKCGLSKGLAKTAQKICHADRNRFRLQYAANRKILAANTPACKPFIEDIAGGKVSIGEPAECVWLAAGVPDSSNRTETAYSISDQLHYEFGQRYVYLKNGIVEVIQGHNDKLEPWKVYWKYDYGD